MRVIVEWTLDIYLTASAVDAGTIVLEHIHNIR
jgi:hypothetical protein